MRMNYDNFMRTHFFFGLILLLTTSVVLAAPEGFKREERSFANVKFDVVTIDLKRIELKQYWKRADGSPYGSLGALREALKKQNKEFLFATNSGIYDQQYSPLGLYIERGTRARKINKSRAPGGNFSMVPNGIFLISQDQKAYVIETSEFSDNLAATEATQSGPLLLHNGKIHPKFTKGSENKKLRSGVGVNGDGHVVFAISRGGVSFYDFADFFQSLKCSSALYLDGSISEFLVGGEPASEPLAPFVGIWSATSRR